MGRSSPAEQFAAAMRHHRAGDLIEAERLYRRLCDAEPNNARAQHLLGLVTHQLGRTGAAALIGRAVAIEPAFAEGHNDLGVILAAQGKLVEASVCFERALGIKPDFNDALYNLGRALQGLGRTDEAVVQFERALSKPPQPALAHFNLALALKQQGKNPEAVAHLDRAVTLRPDFFEAQINLAILLQQLGRLPEALGAAERAVALDPNSAGARNNLGNVLRAVGRLDDAVAQYDAALRIQPDFFMAHYNRGMALRGQGRIEQARSSFTRAFELRGDFLEAELAACIAELPVIYENAAEIMARRHAYGERLAQLTAHVDNTDAPGVLASAVGSHQPFYLPYQGQNDRELQESFGTLVGGIMSSRYPMPALPPGPAPGEAIRLGIVSGFFRHHSNWKIPIRGWLEQLDRKRFHIFGYYTGTERDAETEVAEAQCDRFVQGLPSLDDWRHTILQDAPHVLLYPEIGMDKTAAQLAALRLARVQCCSWGHPVTSGFPTMDYFISSGLMEPSGAERHYSEKLVRLPNLSIYYQPVEVQPVMIDRSQLGLRPMAVAYWCCQSLPKYLPQFDQVFVRIAAQVPDCQFTFIEFGGGEGVTEMFRARLDGAFKAAGMDAGDHCVFLPRLAPDRFAAAIGQCDVVLDSIGWSGCNSILEGLCHNLPVVTLAGEMMRGRHTAAILDRMGVRGTTARTVDEYVSIAALLGLNAARRTELSAEMAEKKHRVYRDDACIAALEAFLEKAARDGHSGAGGRLE